MINRSFLIFGVALATLIGSLVTTFVTIEQRDFILRGYADPTQDANLPYRVPRLGVNADLTLYAGDEIEQQFQWMGQAGINWIRQLVPWDTIETQEGQYDWEQWDAMMSALQQHPELHLIAVFVNTPQWARTQLASENPTAPPENPETFAGFTAQFAQRYQNDIDFYQIWDEPNLTAAWGDLDPHPADYLALLQAAYRAIHSADPSAQVILAALAPTTETGPRNISDIQYLQNLYALNAGDFMDAVAAKPYGFDTSPEDHTISANTLNFSRVVALREIMVENGDGTKPIWASNWGWNSLPTDWTSSPSIWGQVTAEQQINYTLQALSRAEREWPWMAGMVLQQWQPAAPEDDPQWGFALIYPNQQPTPLWEALSNREQSDSAQNGLFHPQTRYAQYSGVWTFGELGADIGWLNDSQLDFEFSGSAVSLLLRKDDYTAYLYPTIDGLPANDTPQDASGNAYIVLTSDTHTPQLSLVPVARNLSDTQHTLHIVADRGWDRWALAGFAVSSGDLAAPYNDQITIGWVATLAGAAATLISASLVPWRRGLQWLSPLTTLVGSTSQLIISVTTSIALLAGMMLTWGDGIPHIFKKESAQLLIAILTAGLIYLEPGFLLTLAAVAILFVVIYNRLDLGLMLVIFWSPFFLFPVELYRFAFPMAELMILITSGVWILRQFAVWGRLRQAGTGLLPLPYSLTSLTPLDIGVIAWAVLGIVSLTWATYHAPALTELRVIIIEPALFYGIFRTSHLDRKAITRIVDALLAAGLLVALIGLWTYFQGEATITAEEGARRLASVYGSPNNVGLFLGRCIPFALSYLLIQTDTRRRAAAGISLLFMLAAAFLSQSVGAIFIGIPISVAVLLLLVWPRHTWKILVSMVVTGGGLFAVSLQSARFARVLDFTSGTNFFRLRVWQSALNIIHDYPLTGLGLDQFLYAFRGHYILPDAWQEPNLSHPHNIILDFWVRLGFGGIAILLWLQVFFWKNIARAHRVTRQERGVLLAVTVGTIGSMVNLVSHGLIDNSVFVQDLSLVFMLLLGLSSYLPNISAID
ncbi:MAG: O-antigen ligase family protein [Anaerolineaceae bacterium]|nr:O-antigen ligase family protein [Anaerolineaceae bacterium]